MQNEKTDTLSGEDQASDDKTEQKAGNEQYKEEAEKLLKLHRQDHIVAPSTFLAILNFYVLFIAALGAFGVLAYYSGHVTTLEFAFVVLGLLLLIVPVSAIWYAWTRLRKKGPTKEVKPDNENLLAKFARSAFARFFKHPLVIIFQCAFCIYFIADAIRFFPRHPRASLIAIVLYTVVLFVIAINQTIDWVIKEVRALWEFNDQVAKLFEKFRDAFSASTDLALISKERIDDARKLIADNEKSHSEIHRLIISALDPVPTELTTTAEHEVDASAESAIEDDDH